MLRESYNSDFVTWLTTDRYNNELQTSELFSTAGRTVKSGLVASAVVSSWTWAATLLTSSGVAYRYGVSGPLWVGLPRCELSNVTYLSLTPIV